MNNPLVQPDPGLFIWTILTFLVLLFLLAKFAWKPLLGMLERRETTIRQSLANAEKAREEMSRLKEESEQIIRDARQEAQTIVSNGKATAEKMRTDLLAEAENKSAGIIKDAEKQIQAARDQAISDIKSEMVDISVQIAEKLIHRNLSRDDNQAIIEEALKKIRKSHEA